RIHRIQGKGTFVGPPAQPELPAERPRSAVERVAEAFRHDIATGRLRQDEYLPPVKSICHALGAAPATVTGALRQLTGERVICRTGRRYRVGFTAGTTRAEPHETVVFYNISGLRLRDITDRCELEMPAFRVMERELIRNGYRMRYEGADGFRALCRKARPGRRLPGAIVVGWLATDEYPDHIDEVRRLADPRLGNQRALVLTGSHHRPPARVFQLCTGNITTVRARRLAEFVRDGGYRSIAFFQRFDSLAMREFPYNIKIIRDLSHFCPNASLRVRLQFDEDIEGYERAFRDSCAAIWEQHASGFLAKYGEFDLPSAARHWDISAGDQIPYEHYRSARLWLFTTDRDAVEALRWLRTHGIDVPGQTQLVTLEGSDEHFGAGLTVCEYDWQTTGYLMAHALIGDMPVARTSHGFIRTEAVLLQRQTTG
ncbi:MAG: GntR family transcriptional regulator, partial [Chitinivibrionales bacterium]|nr:GntR family transcriptional regulator [Chitinivibrionales bacterium]